MHQDGKSTFLSFRMCLTQFIRYVLSPTHLHEFKSADRLASQAPIMSLYLPEQKLGSHSEPGSSSHKFMLKGRQTGGMHRGHAWVFRAESYDTMMAWFTDIKELTEKSGKERDAFVRRSHARSLSGSSLKAHSIGGSSDGGLEEDEADAQPYSSEQSVRGAPAAAMTRADSVHRKYDAGAPVSGGVYRYGDDDLDASGWRPSDRPSPGGRFPSDLNVHRGLQAPLSRSSGESSTERDRDAIAAAEALPGSAMPFMQPEATQQQTVNAPTYSTIEMSAVASPTQGQQHMQRAAETTQSGQPYAQPHEQDLQIPSQFVPGSNLAQNQQDYTTPALAPGVGGAAIGAVGTIHHHNETTVPHQQQHQAESVTREMENASAVPPQGMSSPPIMTSAAPTMSPVNSTAASLPPASSSQGDTGSLSTIPTSIGSVINSVETSRKAGLPVSSQTDGATTSVVQPAAGITDGTTAATKPVPLRTMTGGTISDLHIPGGYPKTPKSAQ